jgi:hypothetical protein
MNAAMSERIEFGMDFFSLWVAFPKNKNAAVNSGRYLRW